MPKEIIFIPAQCDDQCYDPFCTCTHIDKYEVDGKKYRTFEAAEEAANATPNQ